MTLETGRWSPGIGDPTVIGWFTVAAYLVCAALCFWAATRRRALVYRREEVDINPKSFWIFLGLLLLALGINKQLDLQSLLTQLARDFTIHQGWYANRRNLQLWFVMSLGVLGLGMLLIALRWLRYTSSAIRLALTGCVFLFTFVLIRASSFHHIDEFLGLTLGSARMNWILELGSLGLIFIAAAITIMSKD